MADSACHRPAKSGISETDSEASPSQHERQLLGAHCKTPRKTKAGRLPNDVQMDEIQEFFYLPIEAAASKMGIGLTTLKKLCRQYGMPRWPYRKYQQLIRIACMAKNGFGVSSVDYVQFLELLRELNVAPTSTLWDHIEDDNSKVLIHDVLQKSDFWKDKKRKGARSGEEGVGVANKQSDLDRHAAGEDTPAGKLLTAIQQTGLYRLQDEAQARQYGAGSAARLPGVDPETHMGPAAMWHKLEQSRHFDKEGSLGPLSAVDRAALMSDPLQCIQSLSSQGKAPSYQFDNAPNVRFTRDALSIKRQAELAEALRRDGNSELFNPLRKENSRDVFSNLTGDSVLDALRREGSYDIFSSLRSLEDSRDILGALRKEPSRDFLSPLRKEASRDIFGGLRQEGSQDMLGSLYSENSRNFLSLQQEGSLDLQARQLWKSGSQELFSALRSEGSRDLLGSLIKEGVSLPPTHPMQNPFQTPDQGWSQEAAARLGQYGPSGAASEPLEEARPAVRSLHFPSPSPTEHSTLKRLYAVLEQHRTGGGGWTGHNPTQRLSGMDLPTMREMQRQLSDESTNSYFPSSLRHATATAFRPYAKTTQQWSQLKQLKQAGARGDPPVPAAPAEPAAGGSSIEPNDISQELTDLHRVLGQLYRTGQSDLALQTLLDQSKNRMP